MNRSYHMAWTCLLGSLLCLVGTSARADMTWTVTLDTSQLAANYTGPFGLDFELVGTDGNTVTLSGFSFGSGGSAGPGSAFLTGGAGGDLGGSVVLNDVTSFFNDFNQQFLPGNTLTFIVNSTLVGPPAGGAADSFSMVVFSAYDPVNGYNPFTGTGGTPIPTADPTGNDTFITINIGGPGSTTALSYPGASGDIPITVTPLSVPEPSSGVVMFIGVLGLAGAFLRRPGVAGRRGVSGCR
jgi:hypothetical protein